MRDIPIGLLNRTCSTYPLSIATSLALESIKLGPDDPYDKERELPKSVSLKEYNQIWINLFTLFRNIHGSIDHKKYPNIECEDYANVLAMEIELINDVLVSVIKENKLTTNIIFFTCSYSGLSSAYKHAKFRKDSTPTQIEYTNKLTKTINLFYKKKPPGIEVRHFPLHLEPDKNINGIILSHYAHDLLAYSRFNKLDLLESHTGIVKSRSMWYTKLLAADVTARIPFTKRFLQVFGDSTLFFSFPKPARQLILEVSEKFKWNYATTEDRIMLSIENISDKYLVSILKDM